MVAKYAKKEAKSLAQKEEESKEAVKGTPS